MDNKEDKLMTEKDWKDIEEYWEKQYREDYLNHLDIK